MLEERPGALRLPRRVLPAGARRRVRGPALAARRGGPAAAAAPGRRGVARRPRSASSCSATRTRTGWCPAGATRSWSTARSWCGASSSSTWTPSKRWIRAHAGDGEDAEETLKAKILGRWPNGDSLIRRPRDARSDGQRATRGNTTSDINDFTYADDPDGVRCPLGAHVRRSNPRDALGFRTERTRRNRIIRRGHALRRARRDPRTDLRLLQRQHHAPVRADPGQLADGRRHLRRSGPSATSSPPASIRGRRRCA